MREAGALLQDWLVLFTAAYNRSLRGSEDDGSTGPAAASQVPWPSSFAECSGF